MNYVRCKDISDHSIQHFHGSIDVDDRIEKLVPELWHLGYTLHNIGYIIGLQHPIR